MLVVCLSKLCPQQVCPNDGRRDRAKRRVQPGVGGVIELSVSFKDAQTALQQLEVPLQVRRSSSINNNYRYNNK